MRESFVFQSHFLIDFLQSIARQNTKEKKEKNKFHHNFFEKLKAVSQAEYAASGGEAALEALWQRFGTYSYNKMPAENNCELQKEGQNLKQQLKNIASLVQDMPPNGEKWERISFGLREKNTGQEEVKNKQHMVKQVLKQLSEDAVQVKQKVVEQEDGIRKSNPFLNYYADIASLIAKEFLLAVVGGRLYLFLSPIWVPAEPKVLANVLKTRSLNAELFQNINERGAKEILFFLETNPLLQKREEDFLPKEHLIPFQDGYLDVLADRIFPPSSDYFFLSAINMSVHEIGKGGSRNTERFLTSLGTENNEALERLIFETIGTVISEYRPKSFFFLIGPKSSGKSQFMLFLADLIGQAGTVSIKSLNAISDRWTVGSLFGKRLCLCPDIPKQVLQLETIANLKQLVGGDVVYDEKKYKDPFAFVNQAAVVISGNHKIRLPEGERDDAFFSRAVTIPFCHTVPPEERVPNLHQRLYEERGYIVQRAVHALRDLIKRNFAFTLAETEYWEEEGDFSFVNEFFDACCVLDRESEETSADIFAAYRDFCTQKGVSPFGYTAFVREFKREMPILESIRNAGTDKKRGFRGIRLWTPENQ